MRGQIGLAVLQASISVEVTTKASSNLTGTRRGSMCRSFRESLCVFSLFVFFFVLFFVTFFAGPIAISATDLCLDLNLDDVCGYILLYYG